MKGTNLLYQCLCYPRQHLSHLKQKKVLAENCRRQDSILHLDAKMLITILIILEIHFLYHKILTRSNDRYRVRSLVMFKYAISRFFEHVCKCNNVYLPATYSATHLDNTIIFLLPVYSKHKSQSCHSFFTS